MYDNDDQAKPFSVSEKRNHHLRDVVVRFVSNDYLRSVFLRDSCQIYKSRILNIDAGFGEMFNHLSYKHDLKVNSSRDFKELMIENIKEQRKSIDGALQNLRNEELNMEKNILYIDVKVFRKFKRNLDKIEPLTNLIFGLEIRINEKTSDNYSDGVDMLKHQLVEAADILARQDEVFNDIVNRISFNLGEEKTNLLISLVRSKRRLLCQIQALHRELYFMKLQLGVINCIK